MADYRKLADNVHAFLGRCEGMYAEMASERWSMRMFSNLVEQEGASPIEDLFYIACHLMTDAHDIEVNPDPVQLPNGGWGNGIGLNLSRQEKVGNYRVDFVLRGFGPRGTKLADAVVVELDGHAFHDKDKHQRAYEKARDRFLVKSGYRVLHFTGSEVFADPFKAAHESLTLAGVMHGEYDADDPLATGI